MPSNQPSTSNLHEAAQQAVKYLYSINGAVTSDQARAIGQLRQLINEEFVGKDKQISSQVIYDMLKEIL